MNDYMEQKFFKVFRMSQYICEQIGKSLNCRLNEAEIGYPAMYIEREMSEDQEEY